VTTLRHNFDGGPLATNLTVANSGQVPGNSPFNGVDAGSAFNQIEYKDATTLLRPTAEFVLLVCTTGTTAASSAMIWSTAMGSQTQIWLRQYLYLTQTPLAAGCAVDAQIFECDNGAAYSAWIKIARSTGAVRLFNGPESLNITTTNVLPINGWARIEARILFSTTVASADLSLFLDPDSDTPDETVSATGWNIGTASANSFAFGYPTPVAHRPPLYISGLELNNVGWPGPAPFRAGKGVPGILTNPWAIHAAVS
jgi:hypothetical protein